MRYSRALVIAVFAAALVLGAGCVSRGTYERDLAAERARTVTAQEQTAAVQAKLDQDDKKLDQANQDVKKAWDALAENAAEFTANQKAADDARRRAADLKQQNEQLQNNVKESERAAKAATEKAHKEDADKLKSLQEQLDSAAKENAALKGMVEKLKAAAQSAK